MHFTDLFRKQTLFLVAAIAFCVAFLFLPSMEVKDIYLMAKDNMPLLVICGVIIVLGLIEIFMFNNRKLQLNIGWLNFLLVLGVIGFMVYVEMGDGDFAPTYGVAFPFLVWICNFMASRFIQQDEKVVRSMDRLR